MRLPVIFNRHYVVASVCKWALGRTYSRVLHRQCTCTHRQHIWHSGRLNNISSLWCDVAKIYPQPTLSSATSYVKICDATRAITLIRVRRLGDLTIAFSLLLGLSTRDASCFILGACAPFCVFKLLDFPLMPIDLGNELSLEKAISQKLILKKLNTHPGITKKIKKPNISRKKWVNHFALMN